MNQTLLFAEQNPGDLPLLHQLEDGQLLEYQQAFTADESGWLFETLRNSLTWEQPEITVAGRKLRIPRLQCWMGDPEAAYRYSGIKLQPAPWSTPVSLVRERVQRLSGKTFNSVLVNYYRNGLDSVSWHSDDEPELGTAPVIASVSFGAERPFELRHIKDKERRKIRITLTNGSLLLMGETIQNNYQHQLPKIPLLNDSRINLTFRYIYGR